MLGIVIPLKSRVVSVNWNAVSRSLLHTLGSIRGQDSGRFRVVVVGHEKPDGFPDDVARFHSLELPIPNLEKGMDFRKRAQFDRILDKNRKITRGVQLLAEVPGITHWFYLDADDLLASNFVSTVLEVSSPGAVIDGGMQIQIDRGVVYFHDELSQVCGSTCVLTSDTFEVRSGLGEDSIKSIPWCRYPHSKMDLFLAPSGSMFQRLRGEPLVGYVVGHGDNCSDEFRGGVLAKARGGLKAAIKGRSFDHKLRQLFSYEASL